MCGLIRKKKTYFCFQVSRSCTADERECYILDHNGYIILSTNEINETGTFFGKHEPSVMKHLVEAEIFREIAIYDYQALCIREETVSSDASSLLTVCHKNRFAIENPITISVFNFLIFQPFIYAGNLVKLIFTDLLWSLIRSLLQQTYDLPGVWTSPADDSSK